MRTSVVALLLLLTAARAGAADAPITPEQVWVDAAADAAPLGADAHYYRWLSLWNLPRARWDDWEKVSSVHVNGLSREPLIVPLARKGHLLRLNLHDYRISPKVWEQLADAKPVGEPHFHIPATVDDFEEVLVPSEPYTASDGRVYTQRWSKKRKGSKPASVIAPWVAETKAGADAVALLVKLTQSSVPVVSADWFLYQTAIQVDRVPGYYDFLGVKNEKDFQKLGGFTDDKRLVDPSFLQSLRSAVGVDLAVTLQARRLERHPSLGGGYWRSRDVRLARDKSNPLRVLDDAFVFDASEQFIQASNGLWYTGIFNAEGVRQDSAPDFIASDRESTSNDARVHVGMSCFRCHTNGGLKAIDDWVRNVENFPPANELKSPDYRKLLDLRQQYTRSLEEPLDDDRSRAGRAVNLAAPGWTWAKYSAGLGKAWNEVLDTPADADRAARDCGTTPAELLKGIEAYKQQTQFIDPVLSAFTRKPKPARMQVEIWWELLPIAEFNRRGYQIPPDVRIVPASVCRRAFPSPPGSTVASRWATGNRSARARPPQVEISALAKRTPIG